MSNSQRLLMFVSALLFAVFALQGVSSAAATSGRYQGTTNERGTVSFTVSAGGKSVVGFSTTDGYNGECHFHGGAGGIPNYTVTIATMSVTAAGTFTATTKVKEIHFSGTATIVVSGKLTGTHASGTVNWPGDTCGSGASNPTTAMYLETFTAARG